MNLEQEARECFGEQYCDVPTSKSDLVLIEFAVIFARQQLEARDRQIDAALAQLQGDPHQWSERPCETCAAMTKALNRRFGCYLYVDKVRGEGE